MSKELTPLLSFLGKRQEEVVYGFKLFKFEKDGNEILIIQSGIGEIYASGATAVLLTKNVDRIYNFGVCGSLKKEFSSCDIVVAESVVHYDFDLSPINAVPVGRYPDEAEVKIPCDKGLIESVLRKVNGVKKGVLASADKFVADKSVKEKLVKDFNADVCDMEGAGVLLTAKNAGVPCLILKAVSDGEGGADEYNKTVEKACLVCAKMIKNVLSGEL